MTNVTNAAATPTAAFFEDLSRHASEPYLERATGTLRFDLTRSGTTERWLVRVERGRTAVERASGEVPADAVVRGPGDVIDRIATGEGNATAALLRGTITVEGDLQLLMLFQRLFPSPPARPPEGPTRAGRKEAP